MVFHVPKNISPRATCQRKYFLQQVVYQKFEHEKIIFLLDKQKRETEERFNETESLWVTRGKHEKVWKTVQNQGKNILFIVMRVCWHRKAIS